MWLMSGVLRPGGLTIQPCSRAEGGNPQWDWCQGDERYKVMPIVYVSEPFCLPLSPLNQACSVDVKRSTIFLSAETIWDTEGRNTRKDGMFCGRFGSAPVTRSLRQHNLSRSSWSFLPFLLFTSNAPPIVNIFFLLFNFFPLPSP